MADRSDRTRRSRSPVPTAAALSYPRDRSTLPKVTAVGKGALARKIVDLAFANGVRVREDPVLAEMLAAVDVDADIPSEAFLAVAEILAYLYKLDAAAQR